jgi:hypothetical protein
LPIGVVRQNMVEASHRSASGDGFKVRRAHLFVGLVLALAAPPPAHAQQSVYTDLTGPKCK